MWWFAGIHTMPPEIAVVPPIHREASTSRTRSPPAAATQAAVSPAAPLPTTSTSQAASPLSVMRSDHAAVGLQDLAVHPRGLRRNHEAHHLGHFLRLADAVEGRQCGRTRLHLVGLAGAEQVGVDRTRRDAVDAH